MKQFALGVRGGILTTSMPSASKTWSKPAGYLPSRSRMRNRNVLARSPRSMTTFRACWITHCAVGVSGYAEQVDPPGGHLHHHQHVQPSQQNRVQVEEVDGQQTLGLAAEEGSPAGVLLAGRRAHPAAGQDSADGAGPDPVAEPLQFTLDSEVAPARVFAGQP